MNATQLPLLPETASVMADKFEMLFWYIAFWTGGSFVLVCAALAWMCIAYRRGDKPAATPRILGSHRLEIMWTLTPLLIFLTFFVWGSMVYDYVMHPPADAEEVFVIGKQWMWKAQYPGGQRVIIGGNTRDMTDDERKDIGMLVLPLGKPVKLTVISEDVIHDFAVPAFRTKIDVIPGRYVSTWYQPNRVGEYHVFCDQYCGTWHSVMVGKVKVVTEDEYTKWKAGYFPGQPSGTVLDGSLAWEGQQLFRKLQCIDCHTNNTNAKAPVLEGIYGTKRALKGGGEVVADDAYIIESILNPRAKVREGWEPIMPHYQGQVSPEDLNKVVAYLRGLRPGMTIPKPENFPAPVGAPTQPSPGSGTPPAPPADPKAPEAKKTENGGKQ